MHSSSNSHSFRTQAYLLFSRKRPVFLQTHHTSNSGCTSQHSDEANFSQQDFEVWFDPLRLNVSDRHKKPLILGRDDECDVEISETSEASAPEVRVATK